MILSPLAQFILFGIVAFIYKRGLITETYQSLQNVYPNVNVAMPLHKYRLGYRYGWIIVSIIYVGCNCSRLLTLWGRVTHICVSKLTIIGSDNGLSLGRRQAIIWTNAGILLIGPLGANIIDIVIGIQTFSFKKCTWHVVCEMASILSRPQCVNGDLGNCFFYITYVIA